MFKGDRFDFLEQDGSNIDSQRLATKAVNVEKLKLSKQFTLVNPVPKFQSVPATPQFFDLAGEALFYPDLTESVEKHKVKKGLLGAIGGFFGR